MAKAYLVLLSALELYWNGALQRHRWKTLMKPRGRGDEAQYKQAVFYNLNQHWTRGHDTELRPDIDSTSHRKATFARTPESGVQGGQSCHLRDLAHQGHLIHDNR